jgi:hypothetical protein
MMTTNDREVTLVSPQGPYPEIPPEVATCPICNAPIFIESIDEWYIDEGHQDHGLPTPFSISIDCSTAPGIDEDGWRNWFNWHWSMPYVDWLPVEQVVDQWFGENYRMKV